MANYIDKEIICEAYIHLDIDDSFSAEELDKIKSRLKDFFDQRAKFLLGEAAETSIETSTGSLVVKLTAWAGVAAIIGTGILKYPEFRGAVKMIYDDSKMLAEATNLETIFVTRTPSCDRLHSEARTGVIGRTAKLLTAIETLKTQADNTKAPASRTEVTAVEKLGQAVIAGNLEAIRILDKVATDEDRFCLAKGMHDAFKQLPETLPAEQSLKTDPLKQALLKQVKQDLLVITSFQNYSNAVKNAKESLKKIGVVAAPKTPKA